MLQHYVLIRKHIWLHLEKLHVLRHLIELPKQQATQNEVKGLYTNDTKEFERLKTAYCISV